MSEEMKPAGIVPVNSTPQAQAKEEIKEETVVKEEVKEEKKPVIDWHNVAVHEKRVVNIEKLYAVVIDKPFDARYMAHALGASSLVKKDDGTFSESEEERCPALSINAIECLINNLILGYNELKNSIIEIETFAELPFDASLFYANKEVFEQVKDCPKIIVTFDQEEIDKIYIYKMDTNFKYRNTLVAFKTMMETKRLEITQNQLIQNLFMNITAMQQGRTKSGLVVPR